MKAGEHHSRHFRLWMNVGMTAVYTCVQVPLLWPLDYDLQGQTHCHCSEMLFHFQKVIHAFITTRLDCNTRLSESSRSHLQLVQNAAARLLIGTREHITPILAALHWLPVKYSIRMLHTYSPTVCRWHATIIQPSVILKVWLSGVSWHSTLLSGTVTGTCFYAFASQLWTSQPNEPKPTDGVSGWSLPSCTACFIVFFCHCHCPWMF